MIDVRNSFSLSIFAIFWPIFFKLCMRVALGKMCFGIANAVADPEGVQGVRSNPPLELNNFIFMGNFREKNEAKLRK